jgi:ubiquinone/menaquinone biosynthesis C-methylase UbiE
MLTQAPILRFSYLNTEIVSVRGIAKRPADVVHGDTLHASNNSRQQPYHRRVQVVGTRRQKGRQMRKRCQGQTGETMSGGEPMTSQIPDVEEVRKGTAFYSPWGLFIYNVYVLRFNNRCVWRCSRWKLLEHYDRNISSNHLDIGPGTGWYLQHAKFPSDNPKISLLDLNLNSLRVASDRLRKYSPTAINSDIFSPIPVTQEFDSIAANYVFHCLPGDWETKSLAMKNAARVLDPEGVFFGSTILGKDVRHNFLGRRTMKRFNKTGVFHNNTDDLAGLKRTLNAHFRETTVDITGTVALFTARQPR